MPSDIPAGYRWPGYGVDLPDPEQWAREGKHHRLHIPYRLPSDPFREEDALTFSYTYREYELKRYQILGEMRIRYCWLERVGVIE